MPVSSAESIRFHYLVPVSIRHRRIIKKLLAKVLSAAGLMLVSLDIIFCSDKYLLEINQEFLNHDDYTDIITFEWSEVQGKVQGEIYISIDRIRENAKSFDTRIQRELVRVALHGVLHLAGLKDKTSADLARMRTEEDKYLKAFDRMVSRETK